MHVSTSNRKKNEFESIPHHYIEIAALLFDNVPGDIQEADKVRALLEDIENVRQAKVISSSFFAVEDTFGKNRR
jgi:hypothetical protein